MKNKPSVLPQDTAEQMLQNIFRACNRPANTVPLKTLSAYSNYRKERFAMQRTAIVVMLVMFTLLPFLFVTAQLHVTQAEGKPDGAEEGPRHSCQQDVYPAAS